MPDIIVKVGDLFESNAQTLVNTVNCVGIMGKGIALEFKKRFPAMFKDYVRRCEAGEVKLGRPYLYRDLVQKWILNFPTKDDWRSVSKLTDIVNGLEFLEANYRQWGIKSLAVPPLGCGNGQLDWNVVGPTLFRHLGRLNIPVELFAPHGTPAEQLIPEFLSKTIFSESKASIQITPAEVALVGILSRIRKERYHQPIGRVMFQKLAYFATVSGLPTGLEFHRGSYGPFAPGLKKLIARLVNNGLVTETKRGHTFIIEPGPTYPDARERYRPQLLEWVPKVEKVADLFLRLQSTNDAEIAATVHFVAEHLKRSGDVSEVTVLDEAKNWKARRRPPLDESELASSIRYLNMLGWMNIKGSRELHGLEDEVFA